MSGAAEPSGPAATGPTGVGFGEAVRFWVKLGFINFGGPTGQIAIMHDELVERRRWIREDRFLHALSYCMVLPGPEAQQLAIYIGWLLHGTPGGLIAGTAFVVPAFALLLALSWTYAAHGDVGWIAGVFDGLSAAVVGIVAAATIQIGRRALRSPAAWTVAAMAFVAIFLVGVPFPFVVLGAGLAGLALARLAPASLPPAERDGADAGAADAAASQAHLHASGRRALRVLAIGLLAWLGPIAIVVAVTGLGSVYSQEGLFFSQVAVITFGGAYAVLAYVGHEVVSRFSVATADVVAGLGLAESTPGPLIMVVQFLGFLAAYRDPGSLPPFVAGLLGALVTVWATFAPSFLWIFLGAPYVERMRGNQRVRGAFSMVTASVVGVIGSLALTFAAAVVFTDVSSVAPLGHGVPWPVWSSVEPFAAVVAIAAFVAMWRYTVPVPWIVAISAVGGLLWSVLR
ncbi:MAG TPA: chromate efflux transporter [Actinomycetota bacterium]|nr:chromate efflux transporter [Actinomycetota bacterium]